MISIQKRKHRIRIYAGLTVLPYILLLFCGVLTDRYPILYQYAEVILYAFIGMSVLFLVLLLVSIVQYENQKKV